MKRSIEATYEASATKYAHLIETLHNIKTVKDARCRQLFPMGLGRNLGRHIANRSMRARTLSASITVVTSLLVQLNTIALIIFGMYRISDLQLSLGGLIAIVMLSSRAVGPMGQIASLITSYEQTKTAYRSLDELMQMPVERPEGKSYVHRQEFIGSIHCRELDFSYPEAPKKSLSADQPEHKSGRTRWHNRQGWLRQNHVDQVDAESVSGDWWFDYRR